LGADTERTEREAGFLNTGPETSDSIELGIKSTWLDNRLRVNGALFYQKFDDYPDRGAGGSVRFVNTDSAGLETVGTDTFLAGHKVDVYGIEFDASYQITDSWSASGTYSWAQGTQKGDIACNDYFPADGKPDQSNPPVTVEQIRAATGGEDIGRCSIDIRSYESPTWAASLRTEYGFPLFDQFSGYVRLQANLYGNSKGSAISPSDQVSSYGIFSLFAGIRSPEHQRGSWEVMAFVKNIADTQRISSYGTNPLSTSIRVIPTGNVTIESPYRSVSVTAPREAGINFRYNF
ncbi:MAG: TonB-dependent receptor, partial [Bacteroidales bacterium]|nr:TonB-dependent receptor [Bacteroidales bacterium]